MNGGEERKSKRTITQFIHWVRPLESVSIIAVAEPPIINLPSDRFHIHCNGDIPGAVLPTYITGLKQSIQRGLKKVIDVKSI
jgi:hypothetical protein